MSELFLKLFESDFMPHGHCYLWDPLIVWTNAISDSIIGISYMTIPFSIVYIVRARKDLKYYWLLVLFAVFILGCGATHITDVINIWNPFYRLDALFRAITAIASIGTAIMLVKITPEILLIPNSDSLKKMNEELHNQIRQLKEKDQTIELLKKLKETEKRYKLLIESIKDYAIFMLDSEGTIITGNNSSYLITEYSVDEMVGQHISIFYPGELLGQHHPKNELATAAANGRYEAEGWGITKSGRKIWINVIFNAITDEGKNLIGFSTIARDLTNQKSRDEQLRSKNAELAGVKEELEKQNCSLRESETKLRTLADNIPVLCWMADAEGWIFWYNKRWYEYTGTNPESMKGWGWQSVHHPDYLENVVENWKLSITNGQPFEMTFPLKGADGVFRPFLTRVLPIRDQEGKVIHWFGTNTDITAHKNAEEAIRKSERNFRTMADAMPTVVWTAKTDGALDYYNQRWFEYTGMNFEQTKEWGWDKILHPEDIQKCYQLWTNCVQTGNDYEIEYRWKRGEDDMFRWHLGRALPIKDERGEIIKWVGTGTDIHDRKAFEQELLKANATLKRTNGDLDNFIYTASHDLKAPISNIEGLMTALADQLDGKADFVEKEMMGMINTSIGKFKNTIKDLTQISKIQREEDLLFEEVALSEAIEESKSGIHFQILDSKATIVSDLSVSTIYFAKKNLRSIIYNLLSNAIKYRHPDRNPEIRIKTYKEEQFTVLEVSDNGLGVDLSRKDNMFKMFKRLHTHVEGSGLGLYIVKRILDNHDGKIEVNSEVNMGTTFKVFLK